MTQTTNLGLDLLAEGQTGAHVVVNTALEQIDAALGASEAPGGFTRLRATVVELDLASSTTATGFLPDRALVLGVSSRTLEEITGAASYDVGLSGGDQFGGDLGVAAGSASVNPVGPFGVYADTDVTVTANGGAFTAGRVRLVAHWLELGVAP